jgi:hypothetical protein
VNLKRKYEEGSDYMDGIAKMTVNQNILVEMRGPIGTKQSRKTQTVLPTCKDKICNFGFNVICRSTDGAWFLSKIGSIREPTYHPQDLNSLTSTTTMDDATRKCIQGCSRVSATTSTAMRFFEQAKGVVCDEDIIHLDKKTASNLLEILDAMLTHSYIALVHGPKSELLRVKKTRVCNKKLRK